MQHQPLLRRVVVRNYKSIAACDVRPARLTLLVGPNGAGKSNFLDALKFVVDGLRLSLDHALRDRGGIREVRRRPSSTGRPTNFGIRLEFSLGNAIGMYAFSVGARPNAAYVVLEEECIVTDHRTGEASRFKVKQGEVEHFSMPHAPRAALDRLYLVNASGLPPFRDVYDALSSMGFYNLNPEVIRELQSPDLGDLLRRDGGNIASVLSRLASEAPETKARIESFLSKVVPSVSRVDARTMASKLTLQFRQDIDNGAAPLTFPPTNMSDGTLRALGILVALFQQAGPSREGSRVVGIEEPEAALHPAAAHILLDALREASERTQVLVTSHSPELLDDPKLDAEALLAVISENGATRIGGLDAPGRAILREHLHTAGELLRMNQLRPDPTTSTLTPDQLSLFGA